LHPAALKWLHNVVRFARANSKFSVRAPHENVDVNLTVAWWGNARCNAV
jgi:hypothetical protein